jgi:hypothetical protein
MAADQPPPRPQRSSSFLGRRERPDSRTVYVTTSDANHGKELAKNFSWTFHTLSFASQNTSAITRMVPGRGLPTRVGRTDEGTK